MTATTSTSAAEVRPDGLVLAIDFGTQSVRAVLFDRSGDIVARKAVALREPEARHPGWAEHDAEYLWSSLCEACRELHETERNAIVALALTTIRGSVVPVDRDGQALRAVMLWPDQRTTSGVPGVRGLNGLALRLAGVADTVAYFQREAEANWIALHEPDVWARTHKLLLLSGYLHRRLSGEFRDAAAAQIGYVPLDFRHRRWAGPRSWKWQALPWLRPAHLPELVAPAGMIGTLSAEAARATGLAPGLAIVAAAADKACEVLGSGAIGQDEACLSLGTAATVNVISPRYIEPTRMLPPYPAAMPESWNLEVQVSRGFWLVSWFRDQFGDAERRRAAATGERPERLMDELLSQSEPGAMGLLSQPYWSPGLRSPGPEARGAMVGFCSAHTRADVYRALIEGILFALREGKERIEKRRGRRVQRMRVAGGGSRSDAVMQLAADVFGMPMARPGLADASALGAAINAAVHAGWYPDHRSACAAMTHSGAVFDPEPNNARRYARLYRDGYLRLYPRLRPIYRRLHAGDER